MHTSYYTVPHYPQPLFWRFSFSSDCANLCGLPVSLPFRFRSHRTYLTSSLCDQTTFLYLASLDLHYNWHLETYGGPLEKNNTTGIKYYTESQCQVWPIIATRFPVYLKETTHSLCFDKLKTTVSCSEFVVDTKRKHWKCYIRVYTMGHLGCFHAEHIVPQIKIIFLIV